jgi:SNF2 family DNA or RNA helicase
MDNYPIPPYIPTNVRFYEEEYKAIRFIQHTLYNGLTENHPKIQQPRSIRIPLRMHQQTMVAAMHNHENRMLAGITQYDSSGQSYKTRSNTGIVADPVGSGKSLTILSYIAYLKESPQNPTQRTIEYVKDNKEDGFTIYSKIYDLTDPNKCTNLIVVPFSLIPQWRQYIRTQTDLSFCEIKTKADMSSIPTTIQRMKTADLTIVSSTFYKHFAHITTESGIWWERVFIDEADTITMGARSTVVKSLFKWYVTASWMNIAAHNSVCYKYRIERIINSEHFEPHVLGFIVDHLSKSTTNYSTHYIRSYPCVTNSINISNPNTYIGILHCDPDYYKHSFEMPPVTSRTYICKRSAVNNALRGLVDGEIQRLIDADDIKGALENLHLNSHSSTNLLEAVEERYMKEINHIQNTITYRESMEYVSERHKKEALATLQRSKERAEAQLQTFRERMRDISGELCPICYDVPAEGAAIYTPCCNHIYCASCILKCLRMNGSCPLCRTKIGPNHLIHIKENAGVSQPSCVPKKRSQLMALLKDNPTGRFLVFSNHDNPFEGFGEDCDDAKINYKILKGTGATINKTIENFEKGKIQVLFLNSRELGTGLNLVSATDIILYHALTPSLENQVIGRALRMGRTAPLTVHKLIHEGEL